MEQPSTDYHQLCMSRKTGKAGANTGHALGNRARFPSDVMGAREECVANLKLPTKKLAASQGCTPDPPRIHTEAADGF